MLSLTLLLSLLVTTRSFVIPLKRHSVLDVDGFVHRTTIPKTNIEIAQFGVHNDSADSILFIPGLEFSSLSLVQYANDVSAKYNVLYLCSSDQSTPQFTTVVDETSGYLETQSLGNLTIVGESSGSLMALELGRRFNATRGVVLMNSATAYTGSPMSRVVERGRNVTEWQYNVAILVFILRRIQIDVLLSDKFTLMLWMVVNLLYFPKDVLLNRVDEWIVRASQVVQLDRYTVPVLVVASKKDEMFNSVREARRLRSLIPRSKIIHVPASGHLLMSEKFPLFTVLETYINE